MRRSPAVGPVRIKNGRVVVRGRTVLDVDRVAVATVQQSQRNEKDEEQLHGKQVNEGIADEE